MNRPMSWAGGLLVLATALGGTGQSPADRPVRYNDAIGSEDYILGVVLYDTVYKDPAHGPVEGVEIDHALERYPADGRYLEPGDVIVRVDGRRVRNISEFREAVSRSNGTIDLRVWDLRKRTYDDYRKTPLRRVAPAADAKARPPEGP